MFTLEVTIAQAERKFELSAQAMEDLDEPLARFGAYLRAKAIERYKAQNFAPLAESTIEKRAQKGLRTLERKLGQDVRKAMGRSRKSRGRAGLMDRILTSTSVRHAAEDAMSSQTRGVKNRQAVLAQFQSWHRKGQMTRGLKERVQGHSLSVKQTASLLQREARAVMRAVGQPILGGLPKTVIFVVDDGVVTLRSATHETWSQAQNDGETVGHGAKLAERKTIELESHDLDVLESILKDAALMPFQEGLQGPGY